MRRMMVDMRIERQKWLLPYLIYLGAIPMLTTDMYLPALPTMVKQFDSTLGQVNLTLVVFFLIFAGSVLIWGTLSDKYGRKPILIITTFLFALSSFLCATADTLNLLIIYRALQAFWGGASISVSMAVMKDVYEGAKRGKALAISNIFQIIAPITAPMFGALILQVLSWRGIFVTLGISGLIACLGAMFFKETLEDKSTENVLSTVVNLVRVLKIPGFVLPLPLLALGSAPIFLFLGASADIFITHFGLNEKAYGLIFGFNAVVSFVGSSLYLLLSKFVETNKIIYFTFIMLLLAGFGVVAFGSLGPIVFALTMIPATLSATIAKPPGANLLLEQVKKDAGAAASIMSFAMTLVGTLGMQFISMAWESRIYVMGVFFIVAGGISMVFWPFIYKKCRSV